MSSIAKKTVQSITGAALILFLTFHAVMNIFVIISPAAYDAICDFLGANWYALIGTAGLALLVVLHFLFAIILTVENYIARGSERYAVSARPAGVEWSSRNMFVLGLVVCGFIVLHLMNFWYKMQLQEILGNELAMSGAEFVQDLFSHPVYCILYMIWLVALWFHLQHGMWSALHTLGWNNNKWIPRLKCISNIYTGIVCALFFCIPLYYLIVNIFA